MIETYYTFSYPWVSLRLAESIQIPSDYYISSFFFYINNFQLNIENVFFLLLHSRALCLISVHDQIESDNLSLMGIYHYFCWLVFCSIFSLDVAGTEILRNRLENIIKLVANFSPLSGFKVREKLHWNRISKTWYATQVMKSLNIILVSQVKAIKSV